MIKSSVLSNLENAIMHYLVTNDESKVLKLIPDEEWRELYAIYDMRPWWYDADCIRDDLVDYYLAPQTWK